MPDIINVGTTPNDGTGDSLRAAMQKINARFAQWVSVKDYGATGDGTTDDFAACQACITANEFVYFPPGDYKLTDVLLVPDDRHIRGAGYSSRLFCTATSTGVTMAWIGGTIWFIFLNADAVTDAGNSNIEISHLFCDFALRPTVGHNIHMHKCNNVRVHHCYFQNANDGVAMTACYDYEVTDNIAWGQNNACYDQWESPYNGLVARNIGKPTTAHGIVVTGNSTLEATGIAKNIQVLDNILIGADDGTDAVGIWMQGGMTHLTSQVQNCTIAGNHVRGFTLGLRATGGRHNTFSGNTVKRAKNAGLQFGFETAGNESQYNVSTGNTFEDCAYNATDYPIAFQNNCSYNSSVGDVVGVHAAAAAVGFYSGSANNTVANSTLYPGGSGKWQNGGASSNLVIGNDAGVAYSSGVYFSLDDSSGTNQLRIGFGTAAPTTGTWKRGEQVINANPAVGAAKGWTCTTAGTPGTWTSQGNL